jgi:hypothetical protein
MFITVFLLFPILTREITTQNADNEKNKHEYIQNH